MSKLNGLLDDLREEYQDAVEMLANIVISDLAHNAQSDVGESNEYVEAFINRLLETDHWVIDETAARQVIICSRYSGVELFDQGYHGRYELPFFAMAHAAIKADIYDALSDEGIDTEDQETWAL